MGTSPVLGLIRHIAETESSVQSSDAELLRRFKANRDESAFRALVGRHGAMVFDVCRNVLRHEARRLALRETPSGAAKRKFLLDESSAPCWPDCGMP